MPSLSPSIHPTAVIHPGSVVEEGAEIGPYAVLGPGVVIGSGASVGAHAYLEYAEIGPESRVFPGSFVGMPPQDVGYRNQPSRVVVGGGTVIREGVTIHRSKYEGGVTRIGERCMLMNYAHVAHDCVLGDAVVVANQTAIAGHVQIGDGSFVSGLVGVHQFARIGRLVMIAAGSMVSQDIPPFCLARGDRARLYGLNLVGLRRAGFGAAARNALKQAYQTVFASGLSLEAALEALPASSDPGVREFAEFIRASKRGVCRPQADSAGDGEDAE